MEGSFSKLGGVSGAAGNTGGAGVHYPYSPARGRPFGIIHGYEDAAVDVEWYQNLDALDEFCDCRVGQLARPYLVVASVDTVFLYAFAGRFE